ncbi:MAG: hypothetical protein JWM89_3628 [Acidimicrobiales bacterium]|nr:hypothetical protein [Acidimicrobiales bacterium]
MGVVLVVVIVVLAAWASTHVRHPEQTATHADEHLPDTTSARFYDGADRPAGPDAEDPPSGGHMRGSTSSR